MRALILLLALVPGLVAAGEIYRSTDEEGNPLFTDDPPDDDAEPVELDPITSVPPPETGDGAEGQQGSGGSSGGDGQGGPAYHGISITYPPADQAVRHNGGLVPVRVALEPEDARLAEGHQVEILLDGDVRASGASLQVSVSAVARGPHTVRARVIDATGATVVTSPPVDFFLLRAAVGNQ